MSAHDLTAIIDADPEALWDHIANGGSRGLMLAALDAFAELGFHGSTTRDIARRAGMSPAGVYVHYASKLDLLQEIVEVCHQALWEALVEALRPVDGATERVRAYAEAFAAWNARNHKLSRVADNELQSLPQERMSKILPLRRRIEQLLATELRRGEREDGFQVLDRRGTVLAVISMSGDVDRWFPLERSIGIARIARLHGELAVRMVKPWP